MNTLLNIETRNAVLLKMAALLEQERAEIIKINKAIKEPVISIFESIKTIPRNGFYTFYIIITKKLINYL